MIADNHFETDGQLLGIQVEGDHIYIHCNQCGCGAEMTHEDTIHRLKIELSVLLQRLWRGPVRVSQR